MNLKYDDFGKLEKLDVYMVSQDMKSKVPIQIHNIKIEMRDLEISKVTFDVDEEESIIRDLYTWEKYEGTTWEELAGLTWLDITRSKDYTLFESLRIIHIPALGDKAYFQLSTPSETQENKRNYKSCTAYSLEYQLTQKDVSYFIINMGTIGSRDGIVLYDKLNPDKSLLDLALKNAPNWSVGEVDTSIALKSRSFEIDKSDIYSFLVDDVADAYKCVFLFDTVNCKVNVVALENYGKDTDIHISSKNLAKRIAIESAEDSIFTRFYVEGKDGLDIRDVNLGSDYIEDYSYYNSPEWLGSQELCDKYNDYIGLREMQRALYINKQKENINKLNQYHELMNRVPDNFDSMIWAEYGLIELRAMRDTYQNVVDSQIENGHDSPSHINHDAYLINKKALSDIKAELIVRENEVDVVQLALDNIAIELKQIIDVADKNTYFTKDELMIFSSLEVNTDYSDESYVVTDSMPDEMVMQIKEDLYTSAVKEIYISSHPQYSFKTELLNLFNIPEFKPIKSGFDLGSFVTLSMRDNYHIRLRLIAIDIDFNDLDSLTVEFSNMTRSRDGFDDYMALVKNAINRTSASITRSLNTSMIGVHEELNTIESTVKKGVSYEYLFANYASIGTLEAVNAKIYNLETTYLTADQAAILFLTAEQADIKFAQIDELNANVADINTLLAGNITADNIKVGTITAESGIIADAAITRAHIGVGVIDSALIEEGAIGTVQIADGSITDGKIVELTANKITSGTIDAANIEVINLRAANITVGTINGNQISSGAIDVEHLINGSITEDKLSTDLNTKLEQNRIDVSTALQEVSDLENSFTILETDTKDKIDKTVKSTNVEYYLSSSSSQPIDGTWQTVAPEWSSDKFMWSRTKITLTDGTISYTPDANGTNISGAKGRDGVIGSDGIGVESIAAQYYHSTSQTSLAGDDWSTIPPTWQQGRYIWTRSLISYTDGNSKTTDSICVSGDQGDRGDKGDSGVSITEVDVQYYLSTSSTSLTEGSWSTTAPDWVNGRFMWSKTVTTYSSGSPTESKPVCITGQKGSTGDKGDTGASGADAITILLSNESHTFAGNVSNALAGSTVVSIIAYKGTTRVPSTIGTITGHVNGLSTSITDNGKTSNAFTVSATTALKTANGVLTIPITVDGKSFTKNFSFAVSFKGATGSTGNTGASGTDAKVITLTASAQIFNKPKTGAVTPSTITVTGTTQNTTIAAWQYSTNGGAFTTTLPTGVTRSGNVVTINGTTMNVKTITVKAFNGAIQDTITIAKVEDGVDGNTGATGKGVTSITEEYAISTSKTTAPADASFSTTRPTWTTGSYIWTRSKIIYNNPTSTAYTTPVVSSEWEAVNDMEIGGRNLLRGTAFNSPTDLEFWQNALSEIDSVNRYRGVNSVKITFTLADNMNGGNNRFFQYINQTAGNAIDGIGHFYVKAETEGTKLGVRVAVAEWHTIGTDWVRIEVRNSRLDKLLLWTEQPSTIWIAMPQVEKGNKATDWSPAPEDVQAEIDEAKQNAATAQSTADGKNTVIYSSSQPSTSGRKEGDVWFNTGDSNRMYRFNGSTWSSVQFGVNAIANLAITNAKIADGTIQNAKIGNLDAGKITTGTINANRIGALSIVAGKLAVGSVTTDKIGANQITSVKIATDAIEARNIKAGAITVDKIAANAITADKIHSSAITADKIVASAITTDKIAANAITANKILANAVTADKILADSILARHIKAGSITVDHVNSEFGATLDLSSNTAIRSQVSKDNIISSINQSAEEISIEANKVTIGTGTNFERGETYTWEKYAGISWREVAALRNPRGVDKLYGLPEGTMESAGRNLVTGTGNAIKYQSAGGWGDYRDNSLNDLELINILEIGKAYTLNVFLDATESEYDVRAYIRLPSENTPYRDFGGNWILAGEKGYSTCTFVMPSDAISSRINLIRYRQNGTPSQTVGYKEVKLELGTTPTPWTPAPEDVEGVPCTWLEASRSPEYSPALISRTLEKISASLGSMEYFDESAFYGETIIVGGFLNTNLIMANSIVANKLKVDSLSAITGNIGTVTAGLITSADGESFFDLTNNRLVTNNADITGGTFDVATSSENYSAIRLAYETTRSLLSPYEIEFNNETFGSYVGLGGMDLRNKSTGQIAVLRYNAVASPPNYGLTVGNLQVENFTGLKDLNVTGTKNRVVDTENYGRVLLNAYETPRPTFADTGHAQIDDDGLCYIDIDLVFLETIDQTHDYRHFLTKYGQGDIWIKESNTDYFIVEGTPNLEFSWKIEAVQRDYNTYNMEQFEGEGYGIKEDNYISSADEYLEKYEKELIV